MQTSLSQNVAPRTPSHVSVLAEEIISLVDKVNSMNSRFIKVKQILVKKHSDPDDDFTQYRKKYLELIWKSREIAGRAGVAGEDFCGDLLDLVLLNTNSSKEEKIRELEIAMKSWRTDGSQGSQLSHNFKELSNALKAFCTAFSERVAVTIEEKARLCSEIDKLRAKIAPVDVREKSMFEWGIDMLWWQHRPVEEDPRSQMSILQGNLRDIQLVIDKRDDILGEVNAITVDMDSLSGEVTSLSAIFDLMISECMGLLAVMGSDTPVEDLAVQIVELRKEFSPIRKSLAAYARAQKG